jgi:hypothetical protein
VLHRAAGLADGIIKMNTAFFDGNENGVSTQWFAHTCKALTTLHVAMSVDTATMHNAD